ncbi:MAG: protein-disulfide reductase DsbD domain-containing protein, partial [Fimbriimonas sp.]
AMVYQGRVEIPVEIKVPAKAGKQTIKLAVNYQQCNESSCFPPGKIALISKLTVTAAPKKK